MLRNSIFIDKLYGLDVDSKMIDFAEKKKTSDGVKYVCQDFGRSFNEWQTLRHIEGKVSLVFSNYCLHWIKDVDTVVENISRLSAPGGKVYMSIMLDTYKGRLIFHSKFFNKLLGKNSKEELQVLWPAKFENAGFRIDLFERLSSDQIIDEDQFQTRMIYMMNIYDEYGLDEKLS